MELWVATSNKGKLIEFRTLLQGLDIHSQTELPVYTSPPETGQSFEENARIKARSLKAVKSGVWVVGEDSGLMVSGLNDMPGIHSARYAGPKASDAENVAKLLKMLQIRSPKNRAARFICCMVIYSPSGEEHVIRAEMPGAIAEKARGTEGFGYDPIFIPEGETKTLAELGLTKKNQISHRAQALRQLAQILG